MAIFNNQLTEFPEHVTIGLCKPVRSSSPTPLAGFILSLNTYLLSIFCSPGTVVRAENTSVRETDNNILFWF